ncbi:hypothetical protein [Streptomyces ipomoeae]|uniref:hypothetical protein n=1 Tax=Streptomyces ipomoeae TaxID=103232 RepID=UPI00114663D0|nr:hypothetical protein [Streptomyces ipomoeae]TQE33055.1 hypothetical protein Sipo7851_21365 [Streptomyces ipomoeae]
MTRPTPHTDPAPDANAGGSGEDETPPTPAPAPGPTPKDLADRKAADRQDDDEETVTVTQRRMNLLLTREKDQGRQSALRALATEAGLDPDTVDADQLKALLADAKKVKDAQLSDEQRREADFQKREKAIAAKEAAAEQAEAEARQRLQEAKRSATLVNLGATGQDLEDALLLLNKALQDDPDADDAAVKKAADALKKRRPLLFGTAEPPKPTAPPAPSGGPAGAPPQRTAPAGKPGDAGRAMAARMFPRNDAA